MSEAKHYEKHINQEKCKTFCLQSAFLIWKHSNQLFVNIKIIFKSLLLSLMKTYNKTFQSYALYRGEGGLF